MSAYCRKLVIAVTLCVLMIAAGAAASETAATSKSETAASSNTTQSASSGSSDSASASSGTASSSAASSSSSESKQTDTSATDASSSSAAQQSATASTEAVSASAQTSAAEAASESESETESSKKNKKVDVDSSLGRGWHNLGNGDYVYIVSGSVKATGFRKIGSRWYHFEDNGLLSLGWFSIGSSRYYASTTGSLGKGLGKLYSGHKAIAGKYYYFSKTNKKGSYGRMSTGWTKVGKKIYYCSEGGAKLTGLQEINGKLYYFKPEGSVKKIGRLMTGWKVIDGNKYFFRKKGSLGVKGSAFMDQTVKIKNVKYTFDENGICAGAGESADSNTAFIQKIGEMARADMQKTGVLASVTTAQAIVESNYGKSALAKQAKNLFGMKASLSGDDWGSVWTGKTYKKSTKEYVGGKYITVSAKFRKYESYEVSIADHSAYLTGARLGDGTLRYNGIAGCTDYRQAAQIIYNGGYATAPNYVAALCAVIEKYNLTVYDTVG